ncbi:hypothetical protein CaCOL14_001390 [Colletotrichum acutatum]
MSVVFLSRTLQALNLRLGICVGDSETCINPLTTAGSIYLVPRFPKYTKYLAQPAGPIRCKPIDPTVASLWIMPGPIDPSPLRTNVRIPQAVRIQYGYIALCSFIHKPMCERASEPPDYFNGLN